MYVQIIIFLHMIISLKSHIYLTGWNERIGGRKVVRVGTSREWFFRTSFPLIFAHSLSSPFQPSRPPSYSRRRRDAETERQISRTFPKCAHFDIPSPRSLRVHYSAALVVSRARYEISSKTRYNLSFFFCFFSPFALNIISSLKSLLYRFFFPSSFCPSSHIT